MEFAVQHNLSNWRVIVFGAGYVGSELARVVTTNGGHVQALTRNADAAARLESDGVRVHVGNLETDGWHVAFDGDFDLVVNCVGSGGRGVDGYRESYLAGMRSILRWCSTREVRTFVYTSSTSVYAQGKGQRVDESFEASGRSPQAAVLVETEASLMSSPAQILQRTILRLAGIYGPGRHHLLDLARLGQAESDENPNRHMNLIHRDDVVEAILAVAQAEGLPERAVFNVADDGEGRRDEIFRWLRGELGLPEPCLATTPRVVGARVQPPDRVIANDLIKRTLGWRPKYPTFRDGYRALLGPAA